MEIKNEELARDKKYNMLAMQYHYETRKKKNELYFQEAQLKRNLELKQQNLVMQLDAAKNASKQERAENGREITAMRGDNEKALRKKRIGTEMDLLTPNIK